MPLPEARYHEMLDELHHLIGHGYQSVSRETVQRFVKEAGVELKARDERGKIVERK